MDAAWANPQKTLDVADSAPRLAIEKSVPINADGTLGIFAD